MKTARSYAAVPGDVGVMLEAACHFAKNWPVAFLSWLLKSPWHLHMLVAAERLQIAFFIAVPGGGGLKFPLAVGLPIGSNPHLANPNIPNQRV